jgi:hypothetical protein
MCYGYSFLAIVSLLPSVHHHAEIDAFIHLWSTSHLFLLYSSIHLNIPVVDESK